MRYPILDGNVKRVLSRYHRVEGWPGQAAVQRILWELAERETTARRVAEYTQAIMDLGATLCTRTSPGCDRRPLRKGCSAHLRVEATLYPEPKPRKGLPTRYPGSGP